MPGREQKPSQTSWGEIIPGLAHDVDGRWPVVATGRRFREADEHAAVQHFRELSPGPPLRFHPRQSRRCRRKPGGDGHPGSDADSGFGG